MLKAIQRWLNPSATDRPHEQATGIIWLGPVLDPAGYGNVSRSYLLGLDNLGVPVRVAHLRRDRGRLLRPELERAIREMLTTDVGSRPIAIIHAEPESYPRLQVQGVWARIGCTIFETDRIPGHWVKYCNQMDQIWVPSEFNRKTFSESGVDPEKIRVVPYGVDTEFFKPIQERYDLELRDFSFLYVSFWDWRKGFDLLLEAYFKEFTNSDNVSLVIRTSDPLQCTTDTKEIRDLLMNSIADRIDFSMKSLPHFILLTETLTQEDLRKLYNTCELYISTDRANGWGMPCMEAMAMGKPAASINWSGSTQFMKKHNSLLIKPTGRLVPVDERLAAERSLYRGHRWAEVSVDEVRRVMRFAVENSDALQQLAEKGMHDIRENYNLLSVAKAARWNAMNVTLTVPPKHRWRRFSSLFRNKGPS